jgi:ACS family glucarate transporter-like MFS transporter
MMDRPTGVRHVMVGVTTLVAVMLYLDRVCLSIVGEAIKKDQGISEDQYAMLLSAFFWAYALFQIPAGWLGDRFGARVVLSAYLFWWSACTGLMGMASGFVALLALRLGCGIFEAGAYPLASGVVKAWVPSRERGLASGLVAVGGRLGGAIAPVLTASVASATADGWRLPFIVYGAVGMGGAAVFYWWFRNDPATHPAVNPSELAIIGRHAAVAGPHPDDGLPPLEAFALNFPLWMCSLVQFLSNFSWVFIITLFPTYLEKVHQTPLGTRAWYQAIPLYFGILGMLAGGRFSDVAMRRFGPRWGRALPMAASRVLVGLAYLGCLANPDAFSIMLLMCLVAWAGDFGTAPVWAWSQDVGGRHVGALLGWANMWGNLGAAVAPIVIQKIQKACETEANPAAGWTVVFAVCASTQVIGAIAAMFVSSSKAVGDTSGA